MPPGPEWKTPAFHFVIREQRARILRGAGSSEKNGREEKEDTNRGLSGQARSLRRWEIRWACEFGSGARPGYGRRDHSGFSHTLCAYWPGNGEQHVLAGSRPIADRALGLCLQQLHILPSEASFCSALRMTQPARGLSVAESDRRRSRGPGPDCQGSGPFSVPAPGEPRRYTPAQSYNCMIPLIPSWETRLCGEEAQSDAGTRRQFWSTQLAIGNATADTSS